MSAMCIKSFSDKAKSCVVKQKVEGFCFIYTNYENIALSVK